MACGQLGCGHVACEQMAVEERRDRVARAFVPLNGRVNVGLDQDERAVLALLARDISELIRADLGLDEETPADGVEALDAAADSDDPLLRLEAEFADVRAARPARDPAVARLFPSDVVDDPHEAEEYRRYTQPGLVTARLERLDAFREYLDAIPAPLRTVDLSEDQAAGWVPVLNDMRLVLAERIGIRNQEDYESLQLMRDADMVSPEGPEAEGVADTDDLVTLYESVSWLLDSLIRALHS